MFAHGGMEAGEANATGLGHCGFQVQSLATVFIIIFVFPSPHPLPCINNFYTRKGAGRWKHENDDKYSGKRLWVAGMVDELRKDQRPGLTIFSGWCHLYVLFGKRLNTNSKSPFFVSHFFSLGHKPWQTKCCMMTSSNGNIFRVTGLLCGEFTGDRWIPLTKAGDAELYVLFFSSAPE